MPIENPTNASSEQRLRETREDASARRPLAASRIDRDAEVARDDAGEVQAAVRKPYEGLERVVSLQNLAMTLL